MHIQGQWEQYQDLLLLLDDKYGAEYLEVAGGTLSEQQDVVFDGVIEEWLGRRTGWGTERDYKWHICVLGKMANGAFEL